jgi:hypothetical protein
MNSAGDRRAPGATRIPFDGMVEVGGTLGPTFEARAMNLSEEGMSMRTAYLPEVGQPIRCRFEAGHGLSVMAAGEVTWNEDLGEGGEFGIRFTNVDAPSTVALQRIMGMAEEGNIGFHFSSLSYTPIQSFTNLKRIRSNKPNKPRINCVPENHCKHHHKEG